MGGRIYRHTYAEETQNEKNVNVTGELFSTSRRHEYRNCHDAFQRPVHAMKVYVE